MSAVWAGTESAAARSALAAVEAEELAARESVRTGAGHARCDERVSSEVLAACDRVLRERVVAGLEAALEGRPVPATMVVDSALPLLRTGVCGG
jgi:hypothetical protein